MLGNNGLSNVSYRLFFHQVVVEKAAVVQPKTLKVGKYHVPMTPPPESVGKAVAPYHFSVDMLADQCLPSDRWRY